MRRYLVLFTLFLVFGLAATASAQVTYQLTSTPTFVIDTGRAETLGSIRLTSISPALTTTLGSTIQVLFQNVACDNDQTSGVNLVPAGIFTAVNVTNLAVNNTLNPTTGVYSCVVSFTIAAGISMSGTTADHIDVGGARGRIDLSGLADGASVNATMNATPATSSLFTAPTTLAVATVEPGLIVNVVSTVTDLICTETGVPSIQVKEGFNAAFVQYVKTVAGTLAPTPPPGPPITGRPLAGANANTEIQIKVSNLHPALTLTWPTYVCPDQAPINTACLAAIGAIAGNVPGSGSQLQLLPGSTSTSAVYEYACDDQTGTCDITTESFTITPVVFPSPAGSTLTAPFLTAVAQATLAPGTLTTGDPPANGATVFGAANIYSDDGFKAPRFHPNYLQVPAQVFVITGPCTTTLLFPWTPSLGSAGLDTGVEIANTTSDPSNTVFTPAGNASGWPSVPAITPIQNGSCTLYGFPTPSPTWNDTSSSQTIAAGTAISYQSPVINSGAAWAADLSQLSPYNTASGFFGYIIAVCNFQYGHGLAYLSAAGGALTTSYTALIIPDPVFNGGRFVNDPSKSAAGSAEGLVQ